MKILLIGCNGKMGQNMSTFLRKNEIEFFGIDRENRDDAILFSPDVILDFSSSVCLEDNLNLARQKACPIVVATTNHNEKNLKLIEEFKDEFPIFLASNFSILFNLMLKMLKNIKKDEKFDIIVEETHHKHKKDAPSGSCKEIIKILGEKGFSPEVCAFRAGEIIGEHSVKIIFNSEELQIKHTALNRQVFCEGALKACEFIVAKRSGLYSMGDLIE